MIKSKGSFNRRNDEGDDPEGRVLDVEADPKPKSRETERRISAKTFYAPEEESEDETSGDEDAAIAESQALLASRLHGVTADDLGFVAARSGSSTKALLEEETIDAAAASLVSATARGKASFDISDAAAVAEDLNAKMEHLHARIVPFLEDLELRDSLSTDGQEFISCEFGTCVSYCMHLLLFLISKEKSMMKPLARCIGTLDQLDPVILTSDPERNLLLHFRRLELAKQGRDGIPATNGRALDLPKAACNDGQPTPDVDTSIGESDAIHDGGDLEGDMSDDSDDDLARELAALGDDPLIDEIELADEWMPDGDDKRVPSVSSGLSVREKRRREVLALLRPFGRQVTEAADAPSDEEAQAFAALALLDPREAADRKRRRSRMEAATEAWDRLQGDESAVEPQETIAPPDSLVCGTISASRQKSSTAAGAALRRVMEIERPEESARLSLPEPDAGWKDDAESGRRIASKKLLRNRGLTRVRSKETKHSRVANRSKFERRSRKSKFRSVKDGRWDGSYEGEAAGFDPRIKRSTDLK